METLFALYQQWARAHNCEEDSRLVVTVDGSGRLEALGTRGYYHIVCSWSDINAGIATLLHDIGLGSNYPCVDPAPSVAIPA